MTETTTDNPKIRAGLAIAALVLDAVPLFYYVENVGHSGIQYGAIDFLGLFFLAGCIGMVTVLAAKGKHGGDNLFLLLVCAAAIPASALCLGQFLSTFDPSYRGTDLLNPFLVRGSVLIAAVATLFACGPRRFFAPPGWLLVPTGLVTAGWMYVYAFPSAVREWYGTRSPPSDAFPNGLLRLPFRNPERGVQQKMLYAALAAWLLLVVVGRILHHRRSRTPAHVPPRPPDYILSQQHAERTTNPRTQEATVSSAESRTPDIPLFRFVRFSVAGRKNEGEAGTPGKRSGSG